MPKPHGSGPSGGVRRSLLDSRANRVPGVDKNDRDLVKQFPEQREFLKTTGGLKCLVNVPYVGQNSCSRLRSGTTIFADVFSGTCG